MRPCAKRPEPVFLLIVALATLLLLGACQQQDSNGRFEVSELEASWANGRLVVSGRQDIRLSQEARNALTHGVPLTLELELVLRDTASQNHMATDVTRQVLSYLPLSEYYQLADSAGEQVQTFPRLRHALARLSDIERTLETGALPAGDYEVMARSRIDKSSMPPPMRLPVLFSARWKHESGWTSRQLAIDPGA